MLPALAKNSVWASVVESVWASVGESVGDDIKGVKNA